MISGIKYSDSYICKIEIHAQLFDHNYVELNCKRAYYPMNKNIQL
jgi:hypothetical protein